MGFARAKSVGGRIFGTPFGRVFAGFGVVSIGLFLHAARKDSAKNGWPETECRIV
jgi:hypothetical protein